ncbi:MAG: Type I Iterative PKS [Sarcosagium campestre]|nr:MAG: Type I Iterative PKS [Sarcosagium campestre]
MDVLLFGDQTGLSHDFLRRSLQRTQTSPVVKAFLNHAATALRLEVTHLAQAERRRIPNFTTIQELVHRHAEETVGHPAIESSLLCISQFVHFLGHHEEHSSRAYPPAETRVVGLCIGSLAAAAVASSHSIADLLPLAVETVGIAFRVGLQALETSQHLYARNEKVESWSVAFAGINEVHAQIALEDFNRDLDIPKPSRAYVSAVGPSTVTVSGSPSILKKVLETSSTFKKGVELPIPIHAPYHASELYEQVDFQKIVLGRRSSTAETVGRYSPDLTLFSTTTGKQYEAATTLELFVRIVQELLKETLRWDRVLAGCVEDIAASEPSHTTVLAFGPTNATNSLVSALQASSSVPISLQDASTWFSSTGPAGFYPSGSFKDSKLAIVGLAGRFPGGSNHEKLWEVLEKGLDVHKEIPTDRFNIKAHVDPDGKRRNTSHTPYGCFIDNPGHFDPRFFNMSPREAAQTDPMQRLALVTAYEALEMAGYVPNRTEATALDRIGTFYGQTSDDYREMNASQNVDTYFITGGIRAFGPGRINYHFKFSGPSFNVDTACSSSLAAIQLACTSLWSGDCDMAVAGGLSVLTSPDLFAGLSRGQFLSKTGSCKTFDDAADGYCRGDSIGTVILKRLDDAVSDKDNILGVILGAATNHSADAISITHPHAQTQEHLYRKVLAQGGIDALDVDYVEMHGTGTQAGDGAEMESISNVFAPAVAGRTSENPLYVGSVKANVGHGEAASGVTALIKSLLMLQKNIIPPHSGIKGVINQTFPDLNERNIRIALSKTPFRPHKNEKRRLLVNNFSAAGGNTALLLEDYVRPSDPVPDPRPAHIVAVSAKSNYSLEKNIEQLVSYLTLNPQTSLASLSYTTTARRIQHSLRVAAAGTNLKEIKDGLQATLSNISAKVPTKPPKLAFAFTGQGSYYATLGRDLYETSRRFRSDINHFDGLTQSQGFPSFLGLIDKSPKTDQTISPTQVQTFLVCVQMALCNLWGSWGIVPEIVIGHSLGEYAALNAAGVLSSSDTIFLVGHRARLLEEKCSPGTHSMLAVRGQVTSVRKILAENDWKLEMACINGPNEVVLSGESSEVEVANKELAQLGLKCTKLDVPFAFHSSQVEPILEPFEENGHSVTFNKPRIPIISPLLRDVIEDADTVTSRYLCKHAREAVDFDTALTIAQRKGLIGEHTGWIEIGPHPICLGMIKAVSKPNLSVPSLRRNENAWETLSNSIKQLYVHGANVDWTEYHQNFNAGLELLNIPTYAFEEKNYWLEYKNNWSLTKGEADEGTPEEPAKKFSTTTLQRVVREEFHHDRASVVFESDFSEPSLHAAVIGHLVNDSGLCPSSIYADMALTAAHYIHQRLLPASPDPGMNVKAMEVSKPVIVSVSNTSEPHLLQITATADLATKKVDLEYSSVDVRNRSRISNAHCFVEYGDAAEWSSQWARNAYLIQSRVKVLETGVGGGDVQRILRGMAYKLFGALVQYAENYRGMEEVLLHSSQREAAAKVKFQADSKQGNFFFSPYWIDSLAHLSGFVLNANDAVDSKTHVFISHGWESMRFAVPFSAEKTYRAYVKMQPEAGSTIMAGDVYIFEGEVVVGLIEGLKFQQIPRTLLDHLLPPAGKVAPPKKSAVTIPAGQAVGAAKTAHHQQVRPGIPQSETVRSVKLARGPSLGDRVGEIIATEVGISAKELSEHSQFSELGIDSLLSLTIIGRLREELDLPFSSSLFLEHATLGALRVHLRQYETATVQFADETPPSTTPELTSSSGRGSISSVESSEASNALEITNVVKTVIADEMGISLGDISAETQLGSLGMDSLMSLTIIGALREKTGLEIPASLLADDPSIKDLERRLNPNPVSITVADTVEDIVPSDEEDHNSVVPYYPPATSILLQGSASGSARTLFLFPDGSGSATSYTALPELSEGLTVFGLNCPFLKSPRDYTCGISGVAQIYITEIRRRQPNGPYIIGGWSVGGVIAYEAAYQLIQSGETVEQLILIDAPCPLLLPPLPVSLVRFFDSIGLFGQDTQKGGSPPWLLEHFDSSVANLHRYKPKAIAALKAPQTFAIWARDGVCKDPSDPRPGLREEDSKSKSWILDNRVDFGPNSWDELVGENNIAAVGVAGNHFTMMREPNVARLGQQISYALSLSDRRS